VILARAAIVTLVTLTAVGKAWTLESGL